MRYTLEELYSTPTLFYNNLKTQLTGSYANLMLGLTAVQCDELFNFITSVVYGYFYEDLVAYEGDDTTEVSSIFSTRFCYDVGVRLPYWWRKYNQIKSLLTTTDLSLLQTSKVTSSSNDDTQSAGGSLQKGATTPTGVSTGTSTDGIDISIGSGLTEGQNDIVTEGFVDKYTNYQQKYANASRVKGSRSGSITREGSIEDLVNVLEKLPSSFANEISMLLQKHFIFDYDGLEKGYYENV